MSLTLSIEDLARFELLVGLPSEGDGSCTFNMKSHPPEHALLVPPELVDLGISIHFHTVRSDNGTLLSVSTTFNRVQVAHVRPEQGSRRTSSAGQGDPVPPPMLAYPGPLVHRQCASIPDMSMPDDQWSRGWSKPSSLDEFAAACAATTTPSFNDSYFDIGNLTGVQYPAPDFTHLPPQMHEPNSPDSALTSPISCLSSSSSISPYPSSLSELSDQLPSPATTISTRFSPPYPDDLSSFGAGFSCPSTSPEPSDNTAQPPGKTQRVRRHPCLHPGCTRKFTSEYTRRVHMEAHKPKVRKCVPCTMDGCKEVFSRRHDRLRHEVSQHGKVCEWLCKECRRFFSSQRRLENHKCRGSLNAASRWPILQQNPVHAG